MTGENKVIIDCVEFRDQGKAFRVAFDTLVGPVHFVDDDKETTMKNIACLVRQVRTYQHEQDMRNLRALTPPYEGD